MPSYCYVRTTDKKIVERFYGMNDKKPKTITCKDGVKAKRSLGSESPRRHGGTYPMLSRAIGCSRKRHEINAQNKVYAEQGLSSRVQPDGRVKIVNRGERNELLKLHGHIDLDAGYGDYNGK